MGREEVHFGWFGVGEKFIWVGEGGGGLFFWTFFMGECGMVGIRWRYISV